ncbi:MAG: beta-lactamase family protein [Haliscomenobacter sp.]|nr:beta-lactamase family protein [Haliscomenobacter sp.]
MKTIHFLFLMAVWTAGVVNAQTSPVSGSVAAVETFLQKVAQSGYAGSVLAASEGRVLVDKGFGMADREAKRPQTAETVFSVGSVTKQFTAAAILKLEEQGKLSVGDPLSKYLGKAPADKAGITLHHLLTHSAGFPGALGDDYDTISTAAFHTLAMETPLLFAPGTGYEYSNVGYSLLGMVIEQVSGMGYEAYLRKHLFLPSGMTRTGYQAPGFAPGELAVGYRDGQRWGTALDRPWAKEGPGWHLRANGGILSTAADMHRWYKALVGGTVLSGASIRKLWTPHQKEGDAPSYYGYGWVVEELDGGDTLIWHNGGNGVYNAYMGFVPSKDLLVVVSSNSNDQISDDIAMRIQALLSGGSPTLSDPEAARWTGTYVLPSGADLRVRFDAYDRLQAEFDDTALLLLLSGDGTETPENTQAAAQRSLAIAEGIFKGDFAPLAQALGEPAEEVAQRAGPYWKQQQERRGAFVKATHIGTVLRRQGRFKLSTLRFDFARQPLYMQYVWDEDQLFDRREFDALRKDMEYEGGGAFFAPANSLRARFEESAGKTALVLEGPSVKGVVEALKR